MSSARETLTDAQRVVHLFQNWEADRLAPVYKDIYGVSTPLAFRAYCTHFADFESILAHPLAVFTHQVVTHIKLSMSPWSPESLLAPHDDPGATFNHQMYGDMWQRSGRGEPHLLDTKLGQLIRPAFANLTAAEQEFLRRNTLVPRHVLAMLLYLPLPQPCPVPHFLSSDEKQKMYVYGHATALRNFTDTTLAVGSGPAWRSGINIDIGDSLLPKEIHSPAVMMWQEHVNSVAQDPQSRRTQRKVQPCNLSVDPPTYTPIATELVALGMKIEPVNKWKERMHDVLEAHSALITLAAPLLVNYSLLWSYLAYYLRREVTCRSHVASLAPLVQDYAGDPLNGGVNLRALSSRPQLRTLEAHALVSSIEKQLYVCEEEAGKLKANLT